MSSGKKKGKVRGRERQTDRERDRDRTIVNGRVWEVIVKAGCSVNEAPTPIPVVPCTVQPTDELARICIRLKTVSRVHRPESMHFRPSAKLHVLCRSVGVRSYRSYRIYLSTHRVTMVHTLLSRSYGTLASF